MKPNPTEIPDLHDLIEERAAIMEHVGRLPRAEAEDKAARLYGFQSWADYLKTIERK